jgi:hypothetical protein
MNLSASANNTKPIQKKLEYKYTRE